MIPGATTRSRPWSRAGSTLMDCRPIRPHPFERVWISDEYRGNLSAFDGSSDDEIAVPSARPFLTNFQPVGLLSLFQRLYLPAFDDQQRARSNNTITRVIHSV